MTRRPCLDCGTPTEASRCPEHTPTATELRRTSARERGYDARHDRLSKRARQLQPWCSDCLTTEALTLHHTEEAWRRHEARKPPRLSDYEVLCGPCNNRRGSPRSLPQPSGGSPPDTPSGPEVEAKSRLHTGPVGSHAARSGAEPPVGSPGDGFSTDSTGAALSEHALQSPPEESNVRLGSAQVAYPRRELVPVQIVDAAVHLDPNERVVSDVDADHDPVDSFVRVPQVRLPHVTTIAVTEGES